MNLNKAYKNAFQNFRKLRKPFIAQHSGQRYNYLFVIAFSIPFGTLVLKVEKSKQTD